MRLLSLIVILFVSIPSWADNGSNTSAPPQQEDTFIPSAPERVLMRQAKSLNEEKQYKKAIGIYTLLAKQRNPEAIYSLGMMQLQGKGTKADPVTALKTITRAANEAYPDAEYQLGMMMTQGTGTIKDPQDGIKWLDKAAKSNQPGARYQIGLAIMKGQAPNKTQELAYQYLLPFANDHDATAQYYIGKMDLANKHAKQGISFLTAAAKQGNIHAAMLLAKTYQTGKAIPQNYYEAFYWFTQASEKNNADANYYLAELYLNGQGVKKDRARAISLFNDAAKQPDLSKEISYELAQRYLSGNPVKKNIATATKLLRLPAAEGYKNATLQLAEIHQKLGQHSTSMTWYQTAAKGGEMKAQYLLAYAYYTGTHGLKINYQQSLKWYKAAANQGKVNAMYMVGLLYEKGQGAPTDNAKAIKWFTKAAMNNSAKAQLMLAIFYQEGRGELKDSVKALAWLSIAAASSNKAVIEKSKEYQAQLNKQLTAEQKNQANQLAQSYYSKITR
jgi:TPR repeat protein